MTSDWVFVLLAEGPPLAQLAGKGLYRSLVTAGHERIAPKRDRQANDTALCTDLNQAPAAQMAFAFAPP